MPLPMRALVLATCQNLVRWEIEGPPPRRSTSPGTVMGLEDGKGYGYAEDSLFALIDAVFERARASSQLSAYAQRIRRPDGNDLPLQALLAKTQAQLGTWIGARICEQIGVP